MNVNPDLLDLTDDLDIDEDESDVDEDDDNTCAVCDGTGEGSHDGAICHACRGKGVK